MQDEPRLIELIYAGLSDAAHWQQFIDGFRVCLRATGAIFVLAYPHEPGYSLTTTSGLSPAQLAEFIRRSPEDPWAARIDWTKTFTGEFKASQDICPDEILEATEGYREFYGPIGWHYGGGLLLAASPWQKAVMSFCRPKALGPLTGHEIGFCKRLCPHLVRAVALHDERLRMRAEGESAQALMDASGIPLLLLGEKGQIRLANEPARRALAESQVIADQRGCVRATDPASNARLYEAIARIGSLETRGGASLETRECDLVLSSGSRVRWANLARLATGRGAGFSSHGAMMTLSLIDPALRPQLLPEPLQKLYGLTRTEARVALKLADGWSATDAALRLGVTMATMRTHIKRILSKTGCTRQAELVGLVLRVARAARFSSTGGAQVRPAMAAAD